ncbi:MAG: hypothetical protein UX08_C0001G0027 [Candidatus Collierbacteria bacterium GW2011_GWB1_45_35]|uniref:Uncharacterized protein n=2 Tax=Candidatus Collieribacteriota TaxID=1752725 RepID=A0A0G1N060_9BACT|nr:MAG: hypothetical protein UW48_C0003G0024 [Microgenomates group bacterium GW2011_GWC1_44_23]KKT86437.1 MAG: hypothetical protein UW84_C0011G0004 [Candidatus Collierbacteria bacterium GW2011_GWA2_44_99]KKT95889.1 MAG: hypothetical protein UW96_C0003G0024 [Candidatus Collierbacteria bacterium GW2011_GWA1_45_15]KKU01007.1 MAG: hypothetical protein UX01_C0003G0060 [Candidatus Collierbacteria bacterium GW2011_GWB2_45_17]KKU05900.1 MAG: hypothetical protein UX08_C0001G0027 [Candidatus Collierbacte
MIQKISAPISVDLLYDHRKHTVVPRQIFWDGKNLRVDQVGLHHTFREGRTLFHIFSVVSQGLSFRLRLNTDSLFWTLEELSDGLAN